MRTGADTLKMTGGGLKMQELFIPGVAVGTATKQSALRYVIRYHAATAVGCISTGRATSEQADVHT